MDENLLSIGRTAKLMGVSVQTLRYYAKIGLVEPVYTSKETGYRYYSPNQLSWIDRIKYFQKMGFSLDDISRMYRDGDAQTVLDRLAELRGNLIKELENYRNMLEDLDWYRDYFSFLQNKKFLHMPYIKRFPPLYAILVDRNKSESKEVANMHLYTAKNSSVIKDFEFRRQFANVLDYDALKGGEAITVKYGVYLRRKPDVSGEIPFLYTVPEGEYLCFLARILTKEWSPSIFLPFISKDDTPFVIADEYEDNLFYFDQSIYEVRILLPQPAGTGPQVLQKQVVE